MAEKKGLPSDFNLDLPRKNERPVDLGDYLDEEIRPSVPPRPVSKAKPAESNVVELPRSDSASAEKAPPALATTLEGQQPRAKRKRKPGKKKGPNRKQINATPETLSMLEDLVEHVQSYSEQSDAAASEVFHGLVLALYEAKEFIDLADVPLRGRWGTPTAKAFPVSLKNAFQEAIATAHRKHKR